MPSDPAPYPKRPPSFAHRFTRLLGKTCLGAEIGPEACWLLVLIAHTEHAAGFRRPVLFFNEDLATRAGMSVSAMRRARDRSVKAGWLHYIEGAKRKAPQYFVTVPAWAAGLDDDAGDEQPGELTVPGAPVIPRQIDAATGRQPAGNRQASDTNPAGNRQASEQPSSSELKTPEEDKTEDGSVGPDEPCDTIPFDPMREEQAARKLFESRWRGAGLKPFSWLSGELKGRLNALLLNAWWAENYPAALVKAGAIPFLALGEGRNGGRYDVSVFLRNDDECRKIIDGVYDQHAPRARSPTATGGKRTVADVVAEAKAKREAQQQTKPTEGAA